MVEFLVSAITDFPIFIITLILGATVLVIVYISNLFKSQKEEPVKSVSSEERSQVTKVTSSDQTTVKTKKKPEKWNQKLSKQTFTHQWMVSSLKGHSGHVTDLDFSSNGKFLVTCAEDGSSGTSSGSEGNKENNPRTQPLSRRQKKNRTRKDDGSPGTVKKKEVMRQQRQKTPSEMSKQLQALNSYSEYELYNCLRNYTLGPAQLLELGFPVESSLYPGRAMIYKASDPRPTHRPGFDVNAREFIPKENNSFYINSLIDNSYDYKQIYGRPKIFREPQETRAEERRCVRCSKEFFVTNKGEYLSNEHCSYHWGKLHPNKEHPLHYTCCRGNPYSKGCASGKLHVWSGICVGMNGPLEGFVRTRPRKNPPPDELPGIYGLDCEMCYTTTGLELARVTVVARDGKLVYDSLVRPESDIIDYNTRFSGVSAKDYSNGKCAKTLREVQNDLMGFIKADTILIGHGLDNDLRALKMIHTTCVDTSIIFPHHFGLPYRRSLKSLAVFVLKTSIQNSSSGHDSCEDARTCIGLMLYRIQKDFQAVFSA
ncbi:RNA exonuclease 1 homolog isoform X1 [Macrosteles quadrilineatus]|uniref:RNA exonuclease 1 homolog isoform X2 n=1 Tax=Macrosteles quadrilineatus TaxID=74068 RepID=UPI0023E1E375|nr:RNA exonuclease 1 homolog isoform X2 [Macrosteles quadrilineatus]XP_054271946.1 RNA exonuclease 1 homolog isoform X1 [Macrosteles quadrilineatus]